MNTNPQAQREQAQFKHPPRIENGIRYGVDLSEDQLAATALFDNLSVSLTSTSDTPVVTKSTSMRYPLVKTAQAHTSEANISIELEGIVSAQGGVHPVLALIVNGNGHFVPLPPAAAKDEPPPELLYTYSTQIDPQSDLFVTCFLMLECPNPSRDTDGTLTIDRISVEIHTPETAP